MTTLAGQSPKDYSLSRPRPNKQNTSGLNFFDEAKARLTIPQLWAHLNLGEIKWTGAHNGECGVCRSPFRDDRNPSFSIFDHGRRFHDHATGDRGDIFDFYELAKQCPRSEAYNAIAVILGINHKALPESGPYTVRHKPMKIEPKLLNMQRQEHVGPVPFILELENFLASKRISQDTFANLYRSGYVTLEGNVLNYVYPHGIKTRYHWDTSRSTRWRTGGPGRSVWMYDTLKDDTIQNVFVTEGESDAMRLLSWLYTRPNLKPFAVVSSPSAGWEPSSEVCGVIANMRNVVLCFDNDEAGKKASDKVKTILEREAYEPNIKVLDWNGFTNKDLCELCNEQMSILFDQFNFLA